MSSVLAREGDKLLLAWDVQLDPITDHATSSTGPRDPKRLLIMENQWKELLRESPYRVTYVTFAPVICTNANPTKRKQALNVLEEPQFAEHFQVLVDIIPVAADQKEEEVTSEDCSMQLAFCTTHNLKESPEIGLCKRFQKQMVQSMKGRSFITYLTTEELYTMKEGRI